MTIVLKRKCGFISLSERVKWNKFQPKFCDRNSNLFVIEFRCIQDLKAILDGGRKLPFPDGILINGRGPNGVTFTVDQGKKNDESTY